MELNVMLAANFEHKQKTYLLKYEAVWRGKYVSFLFMLAVCSLGCSDLINATALYLLPAAMCDKSVRWQRGTSEV